MATAPSLAQSAHDIYVTTGEHGEVSFSDVAQPGARRVTVHTTDPLDDPLAELDRRIQQTLSVADSLEASRLERERARTEARTRQAAAAGSDEGPGVVYQDRYVASPYLYPPFRDPHGRHHSGPHRPPPEPEPLPPEQTRAFPARD